MTISRKDFLQRIGLGAAAVTLVPVLQTCSAGGSTPLPAVGARASDGYIYMGHVHAESLYASRIDKVYCDGVEVKHVLEAHDIEGWLVRYAQPSVGSTLPDLVRETGRVRFTWQPVPKPMRVAENTYMMHEDVARLLSDASPGYVIEHMPEEDDNTAIYSRYGTPGIVYTKGSASPTRGPVAYINRKLAQLNDYLARPVG